MKNWKFVFWVFLFCGVALGSQAKKKTRVIMIALDGISVKGFQKAASS